MGNRVDNVSNILERDLEETLLKVFLALDGRTLTGCSLLQGLELLPVPESLEKSDDEADLGGQVEGAVEAVSRHQDGAL